MTTVFRDDWETQNLSAWHGSVVQAGSALEVLNTHAHHGDYSARCFKTAPSYWDYCWRTWYPTFYRTLYARMMVRYITFPSNNIASFNLTLSDFGSVDQAVGIYNDAGITKWCLRYYTGGAQANAVLANPLPALNTWYCIGLTSILNDGAGEARMLVNGTEILTQTGLTNDWSGYGMDSVQCGIINSGGGGTALDDLYMDCVLVSTAPVVCEVSETPIVYEERKIIVQEATQLPSTTSAVMGAYGPRVRTIRHTTPISPWTVK